MRLQQDRNQFQNKPPSERAFRALVADSRFELWHCRRVIVGGALAVYAPGNLTSPQAGWCFLARPGGMIAAHSEIHFHRTRFDPGEAVRDFCSPVCSLLRRATCCSGRRRKLSGLLQLSPLAPRFLPALSCRQYLSSGELKETPGRHHGAAITVIPFALGLPLALPSDQLAGSLGNTVTAGLLSGSPALGAESAGAVLFLFNVILTRHSL